MENYLDSLLKQVTQELKSIGIPISDHVDGITENKRAKKRLGACRIIKRVGRKPVYTIEIAKTVMECREDKICSVIAHELIHTCPGCFNHGKKWKKHAALAQSRLGYKISRTADSREMGLDIQKNLEPVRYIIRCSGCGRVYERKRMCPLVRNTDRYRCGKCGFSLELEQNIPYLVDEKN